MGLTVMRFQGRKAKELHRSEHWPCIRGQWGQPVGKSCSFCAEWLNVKYLRFYYGTRSTCKDDGEGCQGRTPGIQALTLDEINSFGGLDELNTHGAAPDRYFSTGYSNIGKYCWMTFSK